VPKIKLKKYENETDVSSCSVFLSNVVFCFKGRPQFASILKQGIQVNILIYYVKQIRNGEYVNVKQIINNVTKFRV
jgi:hypothetical protein